MLLTRIKYVYIEAAEEEQQFQQFRERNRVHHVSYVGTVGKLMSCHCMMCKVSFNSYALCFTCNLTHIA